MKATGEVKCEPPDRLGADARGAAGANLVAPKGPVCYLNPLALGGPAEVFLTDRNVRAVLSGALAVPCNL